MKPHNTREPDREEFMVMIPFRKLLKEATKDIRKAGRLILLTHLFKLSGLG